MTHVPHAVVYALLAGSGIIAQSDPLPSTGNDFVDWGLIGLISSAFFSLVYAFATGRIVAKKTDDEIAATKKREGRAAALASEALAREKRLDEIIADLADRNRQLMDWLASQRPPPPT